MGCALKRLRQTDQAKSSGGAKRLSMARLLVGTAVIGAGVAVPGISLGAMGSPLLRVEFEPTLSELPQAVLPSAALSAGPVHAPVIAAEAIAPSAITFSSRSNYGLFESELPLAVLASGSERFDLAFAGVEVPQVEMVSFAALAADIAPGNARPIDNAPAPLAGLVQVPQITESRGFATSREVIAPGTGSDQSLAASNASIEAAFAGAIDVAGVRSAIPIDDIAQSDAATESSFALPPVDPAVSASAAAQAELVPKTELDARVNGVLAGSVDFQQTDGSIAIRLGSVVELMSGRFSASELEHLSSSAASDSYVTLMELQAAGVPIRYNAAYDEVEFGIDYNDAPEAAKVQVEQIGGQTSAADSVMIDQIRP